MKHRDTLIGQVLAINVLLVTAALFAASVLAGFDLTVEGQRYTFLVLAMAVILTLLVNLLLLRRRFTPLEQLIERVEAIDPADPAAYEADESVGVEEINRLSASFRRLLERIDAERQRSGRLVLRAQEEERKRVARDLHDEVNQALTAILLRLEALRRDAPGELQGEVSELKRLANQAMEELLQLARQLRPTALDDHGLVPAIDTQLRRFAEQTGIDARLETRGDPGRLGDDQQIVLYRVVQEALSNVAQHSAASRVWVRLDEEEGAVKLRVADNGKGFKPADPRTSLGVDGMAERARLVGGEFDVDSAPHCGTTVTLTVP
jgi:two-component system, NarL family, sensor histidine kinase UhpB